jgi:DNA primase
MAWAVERYHSCLIGSPTAEIARNYLSQRNINQDSIRQFQLGFAPDGWSWLLDQARHTEFSEKILEACDLISRSEQSGNWYERFRGRLIFPIRDVRQRPIALGGRLVPGVLPEAQERTTGKYVNSRETRLFSKSETLYGLDVVRDSVAKQRRLTVVEGYTDVIAAWQAGHENVVACLGTAINEKHLHLIKRFADQVTLVLDGDEAGKKRSNEILDLFIANNIDLRILTLPEGFDPFDFLQTRGAAQFQQLVDEAVDAIDHKIKTVTAGIDLVNETHRANQALENILSTLARVPATLFTGSANKVLRQDQVLARLARQFHVDRQQLKRRLMELRAKPTGSMQWDNQKSAMLDVSRLKLLKRESELLQLIIQSPDYLDIAVENISAEQFVAGPLKQIYEVVCQCFEEGQDATFDALMLAIEDSALKNILVHLDDQWQEKRAALLQNVEQDIEVATMRQLNEIIASFRKLEQETENRKVIDKLHQRSGNDQEESTTLEDLLEQEKRRRGL